MNDADMPLLRHKHYRTPAVLTPENLLREARRQKGIPSGEVPEVCLLDPDGDIVRNLRREGRGRLDPYWACYHTELYGFSHDSVKLGVVGGAVGAPFAVLVAEQLFVSGCRLLISVTSAGQVAPIRTPPYFVLVDRALRDEGTSHHYLPPADFAEIDPALAALAVEAVAGTAFNVERGAAWTTDAPYRETATAINAHRAEGILAVEMEAAALYAFARARNRAVICFAYITNQMASVEGDFEKGEAQGSRDALDIVVRIARAWSRREGPGSVSGRYHNRSRRRGSPRVSDGASRHTSRR